MEITYHVNSSLEIGIASDGINNEMYNDILFVDCVFERYYATYIYNIMVI